MSSDTPTEKKESSINKEIAPLAEEQSIWSDEEKRALHHEEFVTEILRRRSPSQTGSGLKPKWQLFLESAGGVALITITLGGLAGGYLTYRYQEYLKGRELAHAWYKEHLDQERETIKRTYDIIGNCVSSAENVIHTTGPEFSTDNLNEKDREEVNKAIKNLREEYNKCDQVWRSEREKISLLLAFYYPTHTPISDSWKNLQQSITTYMKCARAWQSERPKASNEQLDNACSVEKKSVDDRLSEFRSTLQQSQRYGWQMPDN